MPAADFVAAQERLAARRRAQDAALQNVAAEKAVRMANSPIARLPSPLLQQIGYAGQSAWEAIAGREGTSPAFRIGQVDAELLDEELIELLKGQVGEGLKYFGSGLAMSYTAEIQLLLRAALFKLSIWDNNVSYGGSLQGLRYADARGRKFSSGEQVSDVSLPMPSRFQKVAYGFASVFGRYGWTKWKDYLQRQESDFDGPDAVTRKLSSLTSLVEAGHTLLAVPSFALFLLTGRYRTLLDRALGIRLVPASSTGAVNRDISFEYLNRQLVWHAFTEFLLFLLPLVGVHRWRKAIRKCGRWLSSLLSAVRNLVSFSTPSSDSDESASEAGQFAHLPTRTCAICYADQTPGSGAGATGGPAAIPGAGVIRSAMTDVTNPYEANPCGCVYCFSCLARRLEAEEGDGWSCLRCGAIVSSCQPWSGDVLVLPPAPEPGTAGADEKPAEDERAGRAGAVGFLDTPPPPYFHDEAPRPGGGAAGSTDVSPNPARRKSVGFVDALPFDARDPFGRRLLAGGRAAAPLRFAGDTDSDSDSGRGRGLVPDPDSDEDRARAQMPDSAGSVFFDDLDRYGLARGPALRRGAGGAGDGDGDTPTTAGTAGTSPFMSSSMDMLDSASIWSRGSGEERR